MVTAFSGSSLTMPGIRSPAQRAHKYPDGKWSGFEERFDDFSSVAYWYQTEPHAPFAALPPVKERLYPEIK